MSINHFSTDLPEALWWAQHHQHQQQPLMEPTPNSSSSSKPPKPNSSLSSHLYHRHRLNSFTPPHPRDHPMFSSTQNPTLGFNLNHEDDEEHDHVDDDNKSVAPQPCPQDLVHTQKQPMFEKPLTPSDVGKLNRLVIPKQHAEKYFPPVGDSVDNKGLILSFEDELGKLWRFRFSYWNSSQSYVLTKGWSRYVKEKQLDAGDVVFFERDRTDGERLFIGWGRRADNTNSSSGTADGVLKQGNSGGTWSRELFSSSGHQPYQHGHGANVNACVQYQHECLHAGSGGQNQTLPIGNSKRLRLFGVNLECHQLDESEPWTPDGSSTSSQDITFSRDVNQMRNRRG